MAIYELNPFTKQMERVDAKIPAKADDITDDASLGLKDSYIPADATCGEVVLTPPNSTQQTSGLQYYISKRDSSQNHVVFRPPVGEYINDAAELRITCQYSTAHIMSDGEGNWMII